MQVWYRNRMVGEYVSDRISVSNRRGKAVVPFLHLDDEGGHIRSIEIPVERRNRSFAKRDLLEAGVNDSATLQTYVARTIGLDPSQCEIHRLIERDEINAIWRVMAPRDIDQFEYLFDMEEFQPA